MSYGLMVAAVVAAFGLTALCAAIFRIRSFRVLLGLVVLFGFAAPAAIGVFTMPDDANRWFAVGTGLVYAAAIAAVLVAARVSFRYFRSRSGRPAGEPDARG